MAPPYWTLLYKVQYRGAIERYWGEITVASPLRHVAQRKDCLPHLPIISLAASRPALFLFVQLTQESEATAHRRSPAGNIDRCSQIADGLRPELVNRTLAKDLLRVVRLLAQTVINDVSPDLERDEPAYQLLVPQSGRSPGQVVEVTGETAPPIPRKLLGNRLLKLGDGDLGQVELVARVNRQRQESHRLRWKPQRPPAQVEPCRHLRITEGACDPEPHASRAVELLQPKPELADLSAVHQFDDKRSPGLIDSGEVEVSGEPASVS